MRAVKAEWGSGGPVASKESPTGWACAKCSTPISSADGVSAPIALSAPSRGVRSPLCVGCGFEAIEAELPEEEEEAAEEEEEGDEEEEEEAEEEEVEETDE